MGHLLKHKKGKALIIGIVGPLIIFGAKKMGLDISEETAAKISEGIVQLCMVFIGGQSLADGLSGGVTATKT